MLQRSPPLVDQLMHALAKQIAEGEIVGKDGRLPSETELGERFSVSRATVREALSRLQTAGVVVRRQGVGTFVSRALRQEPGLVWGWLDEAPAFVDFISRSGYAADVELLGVQEHKAAGLAGLLEIDPQAAVISIEKIFYADGVRVIHSRNVVPCDLLTNEGGAERPPDTELEAPIYQILENTCGEKVHHQSSEVRAVIANLALSACLKVKRNAPLLQVEEVGYGLSRNPVFYALHHFRGDQVSFRQVRIPTFRIGKLR